MKEYDEVIKEYSDAISLENLDKNELGVSIRVTKRKPCLLQKIS